MKYFPEGPGMRSNELLERFGPVAVVTGASDGIGKAFAEQLAAMGMDLVLVARREELLAALASDLQSRHGVRIRTVSADLSQDDGVETITSQTRGLEVGLLVAAAGFGSIGPFLDKEVQSEANMVDLNCRSIVLLCHAFGLEMANRRRGGIVLFGSLVGFQGVPFSATYSATKGFIQNFAEGLSVELRRSGISVLSVAPGPVNSGFAARAGMKMGMAQTADVVAKVSLAALGRRTTVRPGWLSKLMGWSLGTLPRSMRSRMLGQIMLGMKSNVPTRS